MQDIRIVACWHLVQLIDREQVDIWDTWEKFLNLLSDIDQAHPCVSTNDEAVLAVGQLRWELVSPEADVMITAILRCVYLVSCLLLRVIGDLLSQLNHLTVETLKLLFLLFHGLELLQPQHSILVQNVLYLLLHGLESLQQVSRRL